MCSSDRWRVKRILDAGFVTYNLMIYLAAFPEPHQQIVVSRGYHETVGGTGAGKALSLRRLGFDVTLHGTLGDDRQGALIRAYLEREQVPFIWDLDPMGTMRHVNLMDPAGERISIILAPGTDEIPVDLARLEECIERSDCAVLNIQNYCRRLIPLARRHGKPIWCDVHDYNGHDPYYQGFVDAADYLFMSSEKMPTYRAFMQERVSSGTELVVCTHGAQGATALAASGEWFEVPALEGYPVVDTNGAGDSFFAGVLYGYARGYPPLVGLRLGAILGAFSITSRELAAKELSVAWLEDAYRRHFGESLPGTPVSL